MVTDLTKEERERGRGLHHRASLGEALTDAERQTLATFYQVIEREEAEALAPGVQRQEERFLWLESRRRESEAVVARQVAFKERLERMLAETQTERQTIAHDYRRILQTPKPVR